MKESYIALDFKETVKKSYPAKKEELISMFNTRLKALSDEHRGDSKEKQRHLKSQILPGIASYEVLQTVMAKDEAFKTIHSYVEKKATREHKQFVSLLHIPFLYRLIPYIFTKATRSLFGTSAGFSMNEIETTGGIWRINMTKCPYHDICTSHGCSELCRCFCDSDDITYDHMHSNLLWKRTKTLGRGNDCCDFCLKIVKK